MKAFPMKILTKILIQNENDETPLTNRMRSNWLKEFSPWIEIDILDRIRCKLCITHNLNNYSDFVNLNYTTKKKSILVQHEDSNFQ